MDQYRELILSILAAQLKGIPVDLMQEIGRAWQQDPRVPMSQRLLRQSLLSEDDIHLLERLADEAIRACDGNPIAVLEALGGKAQLDAIFAGEVPYSPTDETIRTAVAEAETAPMEGHPYLVTGTSRLTPLTETPGRYTQISEHGKGGMGRVLLVHDTNMGRDVAFKELLPPSESTTTTEESPARAVAAMASRFLLEGRITAQLEHPSIVPVYEIGQRRDGTLYYTMKLVRGQTFARALAGCKTLEQRLRLLPHFVDLCQAIAYAHDRGVIHRDIKPSNVMIGAFGETVVLDWGIAKVKKEEDIYRDDIAETSKRVAEGAEAIPPTAYGAVIGTPQYMPPEQAKGLPDEIDERSDVYSLGVMLYELLTGTIPFRGRNLREIINAVIYGEPPDIRAIESEIPPELAVICAKAMHKNPQMRYGSPKELADEIERFRTGALVRSYKYHLGEILRRYYARHRALINLAAAALCILIAGGIYSYVSIRIARNNAIEARDIAQQEAYRAQVRLAEQQIDDYSFGGARKILETATPHLRNWEWGLLAAACAQDRLTLEASDAPLFDAQFMPDGKSILTVGTDGHVQLWDAQSGAFRFTWDYPAGTVRMVRQDKTGTLAAVALTDQTVRVIDLTQGTERTALKGHSAPVNCAEFTASGSRVLSGSTHGEILLQNASNGQIVQRMHGRPVALLATIPGPNSEYAASCTADDHVALWRLTDGERIVELEGQRPQWSPDGTTLAFVHDNEAVLVGVPGGEVQRTLTGHAARVNHVRFTPDGNAVLTCSDDRTVRLWSIGSGQTIAVFDLGAPVKYAEVSPDSSLVLAFAANGRMQVWDLKNRKLLVAPAGHGGSIARAVFSPDSRYLLTSSADGTAKVWDSTQPGRYQPAPPYPATAVSGALRPGTHELAVMHGNGVVRIERPGEPGPGLQWSMRSAERGDALAYNQSGRLLAVVMDAFSPVVVDTSTGGISAVIHENDGRIYDAAFHPAEDVIATGGWEQKVVIADARSGALLRTVDGAQDTITALAFSPDGRLLAAGTMDGEVLVWNWDTFELRCRMHQPNEVIDLAFSPDGTQLLVMGYNSEPTLWDVATQGKLRTLSGYQGTTSTAKFSADGKRVFTAGWDGTVRVWDDDSGELLATLPTHGGRAMYVDVDARNHSLYTVNERPDPWNVLRWPAVPWDSPGTTGTLEAMLQVVRGQRATLSQKQDREPCRIIHITTREQAAAGYQALADWCRQPRDPQEALAVPAGAMAMALGGIGLRPGMSVRKIGDVPVDEPVNAVATILDYLADNAHVPPPAIQAREGGELLDVELNFADAIDKENNISLSKADALAALDFFLQFLSPQNEGFAQINRRNAKRLTGDENLANKIGGVWLNGPLHAENKAAFVQLTLAPGDRILRVDGKTLQEVGSLRDALQTLRDRIEPANAPATFHMDVQRGELRFLRKVFTVSP